MPGAFYRSGRQYTDRLALIALLRRLAELEPAALGVDVDFSPITEKEGGDGRPAPHNLELLDEALATRTPSDITIPVFLGVSRTIGLPAEAWLGEATYVP